LEDRLPEQVAASIEVVEQHLMRGADRAARWHGSAADPARGTAVPPGIG
jgi:hypothetical protein